MNPELHAPAVRSGSVLPSADGLVRSAHLGPSLAVTALAAGFAASLGTTLPRVALVAAAVLAGQLSIGWSNDLLDRGRDRAAGRTDKPLATDLLPAAVVRVACAVALLATVLLSLACGALAGAVHLGCVAAGWAYNVRLKATVWSWLPYAVAFGGLPVFVVIAGDAAGAAADPLAWWLPLAGALLGVGAHLLNVVPDLADDAATGVHGLGHRLGATRAVRTAVAALVGATVVLLLGSDASLGLRAAALAGVAALSAVAVATSGRTPFRAAMGIAAVDVALLVVAA